MDLEACKEKGILVSNAAGYRQRDLHGKTLGVVGTGAIGSNVAEIGLATEEAMVRRAHIAFNNVGGWIEGKPENVIKY